MLIIRRAQMEALRVEQLAQLEVYLFGHVKRFWPKQLERLGEGQARSWIHYGLGCALGHGFDGERDLGRWIDLMFAHGRDFDLLPWAAPILANSMPPARKLVELWQVAVVQLGQE